MMKNWRQTGKKQPQNMDPVKNSESNLRYWPASVFISLFHFIWSTWLMPSGRWVYIRLLDVSSVWENSLQTLRDGCDIATIPVDQQFMKSSDRLDWYQQPQHIQSHVSPFSSPYWCSLCTCASRLPLVYMECIELLPCDCSVICLCWQAVEHFTQLKQKYL